MAIELRQATSVERPISSNIQILASHQVGYPRALLALSPVPEPLWVRGTLSSARAVAVVGARAASAQGLAAAATVARGVAGRGMALISGGAIGIDTAAHRGALDGGGRTVVVLGTGIDVAYPKRNAPLFTQVVASGGALVSQFPPGTAPRSWSFPARNRIIAALAEVTVVVEAGAGSGALYTAQAARGLGRTVIALLGTPGCDRLIAEGACAARSAEDMLGLIDQGGPSVRRAPVYASAPPELADPLAARLYNALLGGEPAELSEAAARAGLDGSTALTAALNLELGGLVVRTAGGRYARVE